MKMKNKGKVHPFISSSSSSSSSTPNEDNFSVLNLLPAAILTLLSVLSMEDREVLAYMITRSLKSTANLNSSFFPSQENKKSSKNTHSCDGHQNSPARFDCECFHCYTSFWFRWDSSPNRELIHHAIETFEDHLNNGELVKNGKSKRKDRMGRRKIEKVTDGGGGGGVLEAQAVESSPENMENLVVLPDGLVAAAEVDSVAAEGEMVVESSTAKGSPAAVVRGHKGLARKVLPDVIGIFDSRLWSLWRPNV